MSNNGKAMLVVAHGVALVVAWQGDTGLSIFLEYGASAGESFAPDDVGLHHATLSDGVWIGELTIDDDGEGDWPGSREYALNLRNERPATREEWQHHVDAEWPWETDPSWSA